MQNAVLKSCPTAEGILPYLLYSDSSVLKLGGHSFHPLVVFSGAGTINEARSATGYRRIAFLPVVKPHHMGLQKLPRGAQLDR